MIVVFDFKENGDKKKLAASPDSGCLVERGHLNPQCFAGSKIAADDITRDIHRETFVDRESLARGDGDHIDGTLAHREGRVRARRQVEINISKKLGASHRRDGRW